jgi:hypothetical protein
MLSGRIWIRLISTDTELYHTGTHILILNESWWVPIRGDYFFK